MGVPVALQTDHTIFTGLVGYSNCDIAKNR